MKIHPLILGVVVAAALAPGAMGAADRAMSPGHQTKDHGASATQVLTKTGRTEVKPTAPSLPLYIYQPGPLQVPAVDPSYECASAMTDCTAQEACELWGSNCNQIGAPLVTSAESPNESIEQM
jgi:hypothetical protein